MVFDGVFLVGMTGEVTLATKMLTIKLCITRLVSFTRAYSVLKPMSYGCLTQITVLLYRFT